MAADANEAGIVTKLSPRPVGETVTRLTGMVTAKGMQVIAVVGHAAGARQVGLELRDTVLGARHHLDADLAANLAGIDPLTDALVAPLAPGRMR